MRKIILLSLLSIVILLAIVVSLVTVGPVLVQLNENNQIRVEIQKEELQKENLYDCIEEICIEYSLEKNEILVSEFNNFLDENNISQERILDYTKRLQTYNSIKYEEYVEKEKQLENAFNNKEVSEETFEKEKELLLKTYESEKNSFEDYLTSREKTVFENSEEIIYELFQLIN